MTDFVRLNEYNDNEGEVWNWWLQVTGNESQIGKLAALLNGAQEDSEDYPDYELGPYVEPERVVDVLVKYSEDGYYASHNKVVGTFTCPETDDILQHLYKGGIRNLFDKAAPFCEAAAEDDHDRDDRGVCRECGEGEMRDLLAQLQASVDRARAESKAKKR